MSGTGTGPRIAIAPGEPAGIGPDIVIEAFQERRHFDGVVLADPEALRERAEQLRLPLTIEAGDTRDAGRMTVLPLSVDAPVAPGVLEASNAEYVLRTLRTAVDRCLAGDFAALVTGPVQKSILDRSDAPFSGHTGFLRDACGVGDVVMMLVGDALRVALATTHVPLAAVPALITPERIDRKLRILMDGLRTAFGIDAPRVAVAGLNPHAGGKRTPRPRGDRGARTGVPPLARRRRRSRRSPACRHHLPTRRRGRRHPRDVPRPGPAGPQVRLVRDGGQRDARTAFPPAPPSTTARPSTSPERGPRTRAASSRHLPWPPALPRARKRFGQHFLADPSVVDAIVAALSPRQDDRLVEIGPGRGALTGALAGSGARVTVVELDRDLVGPLRRQLPDVTVVEGDALTVDLAALAAGAPTRIVGNLPYNISTPLLNRLFDACAAGLPLVDMHFMLQAEVVDRLCAAPGTKAWGRLSVIAQYHCDVVPLFTVPPDAFTPPPTRSVAVRAPDAATARPRRPTMSRRCGPCCAWHSAPAASGWAMPYNRSDSTSPPSGSTPGSVRTRSASAVSSPWQTSWRAADEHGRQP